MKSKLFRMSAVLLLLTIVVSLVAIPAAAENYTLFEGVEDGSVLIGGLSGYWILYQIAGIPSEYATGVTNGVNAWNRTYSSTGCSFTYASDTNPNYGSSKLRFVISDYGLDFRGNTYRYDANGYDTAPPDLRDYGPRRDWAYSIMQINREAIEHEYTSESKFSKTRSIQCTAAHEMGHAFGLKHYLNDNPVTLMHPQFSTRENKNVYAPTQGDIDGVYEIYITGVDSNNNASASTQAVTPPKQSLADFTAERDRVAVASFRGYGDIVARGNGVINLGGHIMDDTAYYVECLFETEQGEIIRALEYIGFGAARSMQHVLPKSGQYLLFLSESMGYSYLVDPELSLQHVVNGEVVWNPAAQAALDLPATRMDVASLTQ